VVYPYFVDGVSGSDNNTGKKPTEAKATIQAAVTLATRGDVIYVRPLAYKIGTGFNRYTEDIAVTLGGSGGVRKGYE